MHCSGTEMLTLSSASWLPYCLVTFFASKSAIRELFLIFSIETCKYKKTPGKSNRSQNNRTNELRTQKFFYFWMLNSEFKCSVFLFILWSKYSNRIQNNRISELRTQRIS